MPASSPGTTQPQRPPNVRLFGTIFTFLAWPRPVRNAGSPGRAPWTHGISRRSVKRGGRYRPGPQDCGTRFWYSHPLWGN